MTIRVLDGLPRQSLADALSLCRELVEDPDFPTVKRWREAGLPYFVSDFEENMTSFDHLQIQLETFVENLLFA